MNQSGWNEIHEFLSSKENSETDKHLVKWQYRMLGDFETSLMKTIALADEDNLDLLKRAFPFQVEAYLDWTRGGAGRRIRKDIPTI